jgi:hypothetical protein
MKKILGGSAAIVINFFLLSAAHAVTISMALPGTNSNSSSSSPGAFVANFYQFALMIGGVLAFGVIVYGGVKYMASAGNPSGQSDAKEWIESALLGLLLLVGAYFVLNVVNPQLRTLSLPSNLQTVNITQTGTGGAGVCSNITCQSGFLPTPVGATNNLTCVCQNANGGQSCGGANVGTCPSGETCAASNTGVGGSSNPNYSCQAASQYTCGVAAPPNSFGNGKCANPQYSCINYNSGTTAQNTIYSCQP